MTGCKDAFDCNVEVIMEYNRQQNGKTVHINPIYAADAKDKDKKVRRLCDEAAFSCQSFL